MKKEMLRWMLVILIFGVVGAFFYFDLLEFLTLEGVKAQKQIVEEFYLAHPLQTIVIFMLTYIALTAISFPGGTVMTLLSGALFGLYTGTVLVSFASTIGATCAFLGARFILRDWVQERFARQLKPLEEGVQREGIYYLLTLRLIPAIPFAIVNVLMALTSLKTSQFFLVSQLGMLPATIVYVNAGTQLGSLNSLSEIISVRVLMSLALLALVPWLAKYLLDFFRRNKNLRKYKKPKTYDYNLIVIGGGAAGLVSAYIASTVKARVALIEKNKMGGDCLNTGCVPSKALIATAKILSYQHRAKDFGLGSISVEFDFAKVMERVQEIIRRIEPHDSIERYRNMGVDCISGDAVVRSPYEVGVNNKILTTRNIILATGAEPLIPSIDGLSQVPFCTTETIWSLRNCPRRLLVLGGGPIGVEIAQCFQRLGSQVTIVEASERILNKEDAAVSHVIHEQLKKEGVRILAGWRAVRFELLGAQPILFCENDKAKEEEFLEFDLALLAVGRRPRVKGFGLEELGIELSPRGSIVRDEFLRTNFPNIYACGDVAGEFQFTHMAAHEAWFASVNSLFNPLKKFKADYRVVPWCTYTDPEVARVGMNEMEATAKNQSFEITTYEINDLDRAITSSEDKGFVKILTHLGTDKILGATIVSAHAGELISEFVTAMKQGIGLNKILGTIHVYPTMAEANKYVAGRWKMKHKPEKALRWIEKFHRWRRRG